PRILQAFNKPVRDWLEFFCFTTFTDRDGKYQLAALAESGFDPLARTTRFMLTEEAHHLAVGGNGIGRVVQRTAELMRDGVDPRTVGAIPLEVLQRYVNDWASSSHDLFGGEDSTNAADAFSWGLKGRYREGHDTGDPSALGQSYAAAVERDGRLGGIEIPMRRAMNALLCDAYHADCLQVAERWNRTLARAGLEARISIPSPRFNRQIGIHAGKTYDPAGNPIAREEFDARLPGWLPSDEDRAHVASCMLGVRERGRFANWIAPPASGVDGKPVDFEYVRIH
ncbi:MAG: benzoyl-CoA 2,3-epoxidase subunit BoxB, partial [Deltaproteobacteria bacterium]|nr:benzoyl-CoA 2,3-epoxidase subunit BoxB [Deltaproteobacteria bacterium]